MAPAHRLLTGSCLILALGATLAAVPASSASAAATCRGEAATLVGSRGAVLTGTEGRDVVVTDDAVAVTTLGGDDLVCVTGRTAPGGGYRSVRVDTGAGADLVDGTGAPDWAVEAVLGEGTDRLYGGPQGDRVTTGAVDADVTAGADTDADTVLTGPGDDSVTSGQDAAANADVIDLAEGDDTATWSGRGSAPAGQVIGGGGSNTLLVRVAGAGLVLDNAASRGTLDGSDLLRWSGMTRFHVWRSGPTGSDVTFRGGAGAETLEVSGLAGSAAPGVLDVDLGAGRDVLAADAPGAPASAYAGGPGDDRLIVGSATSSLALDLRRQQLVAGATTAPATGFEGAHLLARSVSLRGTDGPDDLSSTGCDQRIVGRAGRDTLSSSLYDAYFEQFVFDCTRRSRVWGGDGRDRLRGGNGLDRLIGGAGRDRAEGRGGRDLCRAEVTVSCERR